ncbi:hypothetical protein SAMN05216517_10658 [Janthinobacterium sp. OK676]|uniref:hypothetical protein n=1 Tax=Janthinobacterium sp. OK676 TaxID=1855295 RepID=UPI00088DC3E1|nr:hypothetical protein [Janthinobacterium sp. OK676]SDM75190.1 hypothetical protein SAMN05216517_10658 [Janthinobacterium sp. OK676]
MKTEIEYQCQESTCQATFHWTVSFCPFCGTKQTVVKVKIISPQLEVQNIDGNTSLPNDQIKIAAFKEQSDHVLKDLPLSNHVLLDDEQKKFNIHIADSISNSYCDSVSFSSLLRYGKKALALDVRRVESILSMALQRLNVVNEKVLLDELDALLHVFTDTEKKLDKKSRGDALQSVCKPRPGAMRGVDPETAERYINDFCRKHSVMQRSGIWGWKIL